MANKVGRPKGSGRGQHAARILKGVTEQSLTRIAGLFDQHPEMVTPLEFFIGVYTDETLDVKTRMFAAERALPYMHSRLPETVEHEHSGKVENVHRFALMTKLFGTRRPEPVATVEDPQPQLTDEPTIEADFTEKRSRVSTKA